MITIEQHLKNNRANIEADARIYAKSYGVSIEDARRDVEDEYKQGWYEAAADARYNESAYV